jgi:hypothetical protein
MNVELEDWKNGWSGISIGIAKEEIERLIELLQMLKTDPEQHFHISSDYKGNGGVGDIEIYVKTSEQKHNMSLSGQALGAGEEI